MPTREALGDAVAVTLAGAADAGSEPPSEQRIKIQFWLEPDEDGYPPARAEGLWAVQLDVDLARLDNIPWFARGVADGDIVRFTTDADGQHWYTETEQWSGNCTIRVVPAVDGHLRSSRQAVLDAFAALGVEGEGLNEQWPIVALSVPPDADLYRINRLLVEGEAEGRWHYEEGCIGDAWESASGSTCPEGP
jgi:hypothetical protein